MSQSQPFYEPGRCRNLASCRLPASALPSDYVPFSLEWTCAYRALYASMPTHPLSFSLPNLWAWREWMELDVRFADGLAWLRCMKRGSTHLAPVGDWHSVDWAALQPKLQAMGRIVQVPEALAQLWQEKLTCTFTVQENRDAWEYLYTAADLATLAGKRYHMQRNHVNAYIREHGEPDLRTLDSQAIPDMLALTARWHEQHEISDSTRAETASLERLCSRWDEFDLVAEGLYCDGALAAFAVGYELDDQTMAVLYEKAEPGLRGAFPTIASSFSRLALERGKTLVNRAEDMGEEGMRKSKMLYRPMGFQQMYIVEF